MAFPTSEEKAAVIRAYAQRYGIDLFVETGTSVGATVAALVNDFTSIITIEIDPETCSRARDRFSSSPNVNCICADSGVALHQLLPHFHEPVLFWLDGHYSGPGTGRGKIDTPIVSELEAALQAPHGSVILIDDARLFGGMEEHTEEFADYPDIAWVFDTAAEYEYEGSLEDDIIRFTPCV